MISNDIEKSNVMVNINSEETLQANEEKYEDNELFRVITRFFIGSRYSGPWTGVLAAAAWEEDHYLAPALSTGLLYLSSLLISLRPDSKILSRLWIVAGGVMVCMGWLSSLSQNFTDKTDIWRDICIVQTVLYVFILVVPLIATDTEILVI